MSAGFFIHGGRLAEVCAHFGGASEDWLDLSTGINPDAWPGTTAQPIDWRGLPDPSDLDRLERRASRYFGIDPALCCAVPGSEVGLRLIARIIGLPGLHLPLAYGTHAGAFTQADPVASAALLSAEPAAFVIANPNNPDGRLTSPETLFSALEHQEANGGWLVVDEAFADCQPEWSIAPHVAGGRRLIVLRSFGKFFGLAGVRLGFAIAPPALLKNLRRLLGDWPVCAAALSFGLAAYDDDEWIAAARRDLPVRAARLDGVLRRHRLAPMGECPLFRLVNTPDAHTLFNKLAEQRILTRPFAAHPRLLRFGLPDGDVALARLDRALAKGIADG